MSYNDKSCINLNSEQKTTNWFTNSSSKPLEFVIAFYPPILSYNFWYNTNGNKSILYYQFCGPLVVLLKCFAQRINTEKINVTDCNRLHIQPLGVDSFDTFDKLLEYWLRDHNLPQLFTFPVVPRLYYEGVNDEFCGLTRYIAGLDEEVLLSITQRVDRPLFTYLNCWDQHIYIGVFLSLLALSIISGLKDKSLKSIFESFWDYSTIILSDYMCRVPNHFTIRLLISIWLLVNTLLLSVFSGELYESIINRQIIEKIENKEDLYFKEYWKESKIILVDGGRFLDYTLNGLVENDPMAIDFGRRIEFQMPFEILYNESLQKEIMISIFKENKVLCVSKLATYWFLREFQRKWPLFMDNYIEGFDFYISKPAESGVPYYLFYIRELFNQSMVQEFNLIISRLQESGLYQYETKRTVYSKGFGREVDLECKIPNEEIVKNIAFKDINGVLVLIPFGFVLAFIVFLFEILIYYYYNL